MQRRVQDPGQSMQQIWTILKHDGPNHLVTLISLGALGTASGSRSRTGSPTSCSSRAPTRCTHELPRRGQGARVGTKGCACVQKGCAHGLKRRRAWYYKAAPNALLAAHKEMTQPCSKFSQHVRHLFSRSRPSFKMRMFGAMLPPRQARGEMHAALPGGGCCGGEWEGSILPPPSPLLACGSCIESGRNSYGPLSTTVCMGRLS